MANCYSRLFFLLLVFFVGNSLQAQRVMLIEKSGSPNNEKIYEGQYIEFRLKEYEDWYSGEIKNYLVDQGMIEFEDRYVKVDDIYAFRERRGFVEAMSVSIATFGVSWSGFALVGNLTDGDPTTNYRTADAIVTGVSLGLGYTLYKLLGRKVTRFGKRKRLRLVDIRFD